MADLIMPNLNNKSKQYLFKNKVNGKKKSRMKLFRESFLMTFSALIILLINYFIPQKKVIFNSFLGNIQNIFENLIEFFVYFYQVLIALFIILSMLIALLLLLGSLYRLYRIINIKSKKYNGL